MEVTLAAGKTNFATLGILTWWPVSASIVECFLDLCRFSVLLHNGILHAGQWVCILVSLFLIKNGIYQVAGMDHYNCPCQF